MTASATPPLIGGNIYTDWSGANIQIQTTINGKPAQYLLNSTAGADINKAIWKIKLVINDPADTDFNNLPTARDYYPLDSNNLPSTNPEFIAKNYATYTYV